MVDARETASKLFSKTRWKSKISGNEEPLPAHPKSKPAPNFNFDDDVNDFLRPSTDKARQTQVAAAAAAALTAAANRPRIDVASAQRWPGAQYLVNSAAGSQMLGPGGLKRGRREKGLTVSFARTVPDIIGHGGDECEDPSIEVSKRKTTNAMADSAASVPPKYQDDTNLGTYSNGVGRTKSQTEQRNGLTRTLTSHGEMSPELGQRLQMGQINAYAAAPRPAPLRMGTMGLGDRPRMLSRAPTGFDNVDAGRRPSQASSLWSWDSDNSPIVPKGGSIAMPEGLKNDQFDPKPLKRAATNFHNPVPGQLEPPMPTIPQLAETQTVNREDDSPLDAKALQAERYLHSEPSEPSSFYARVKQKMRADEGRALHEAARRRASGMNFDDSDSSPAQSPENKTPPSRLNVSLTGRSQLQASPSPGGVAARKARGPSPNRSALPPGSFPLDTYSQPPSPGFASFASSTSTPYRASPTKSAQGPSLDAPPFASSSPAQNHIPPSSFQSVGTPLSATSQPAQMAVRARADASARSPAALARSDTKSYNDAAYHDFAERVTHMKGIFQLTAQLGGQLYTFSPMQWLRAATWWFLRGRSGMESQTRSQPKFADPPQERLTQPHVDLAKVWWILNEVLPNHPDLQRYGRQGLPTQSDLARQAGDAPSADAFEMQIAITHYLKLLVGSMKKHQSMPPTQALIQGQNQSVWEEYPPFALDAVSVLTTGPLKASTPQSAASLNMSLSQCIPLTDTSTDFCYFRMFVQGFVQTDDPNTDRVPMPLVVCVLRPKNGYLVKLSICSQNDLVNIFVDSNPETGPTWKEVAWKKQTRQLSIQLRYGFDITLELSEADFRSLWAIVDHTNRVDMDLRERRDERFACKLYPREVVYQDLANPGAFPVDRVPGCALMVFEKMDQSSEGTGKRKLHRGYRLALAAASWRKQVHLVNHELGTRQEPISFEYVTESDQTPAMRLRFREETPDKKHRVCELYLSFQEGKDRNHLFGTFTSMNINQGEMAFAQVPLKSFHMESADQAEGFSQKGSRVLERLQWQEAKVINQDPEEAGLEAAPTVMSESLRIVCRHSTGILSDRMNLGPGELLVRLPVDGAAEMTVLREAQHDLTMAIDSSRADKEVPDSLAELITTLSRSSTLRTFQFNSFKDLHSFQLAVTGFEVKFDAIAAHFSISRRRMVVPIYKQWTANTIRIQIVEQDNIVQLLAFFEEFSHADAMNFQLRPQDVFEKKDSGGKYGLKLVDAKFALPVEERRGEGKMQKEEGRLTGWAGAKRKYVCLDEIEYPGEHDDILIQFETAEARDCFAEALPASTTGRNYSLRRKI